MMEINFKQQRWHLSNRMSDELAYIISYFTLFLSCPGQWPVLDGNGLIDHHRIYLQVAVPVGKWTQTHTKIVSVTCHLRFNKCYVCTWFCVFHSVALALLRWGAPLHGQHLCVCVWTFEACWAIVLLTQKLGFAESFTCGVMLHLLTVEGKRNRCFFPRLKVGPF